MDGHAGDECVHLGRLSTSVLERRPYAPAYTLSSRRGRRELVSRFWARENRWIRSELPSGTVAFLFTDVEGSTQLLQELGGGYADVLAEHRRVLREMWARHRGVEVDTAGDAFCVAFSRASDAVAAARGAQAALAEGPVRVRTGLHSRRPGAPARLRLPSRVQRRQP